MKSTKNSTSHIEKKFVQIIDQIFAKKFPKKIAVGISGGADSMALTFLLQKICEQKKCQLIVLTVDHRFRTTSGDEAKSVAKIMKKNSLEHFILKSPLDLPPTKNIESSLREIRYNLLSEFCIQNKIEYLFIAHHMQDIAENFLIRLFRGSGIDGLSALNYITDLKEIKLVRPLLDFEKNELEEYLSFKKISWFHDESNDDEKYLRNKIRKFLSGLKDYKLINNRISLVSKSILESRKLIEESMIEDASDIVEFSDLGYFLLKLNNFKNLHQQKAWRYLAWILMDVSGNFYKPRFEDLNNFYKWIIENKNHKPRSFYGCIAEKYYDDRLIIYREKSKIKSAQLKNNIKWDNRFLIKINSEFLTDDIIVDTADSRELNELAKEFPELKKLKNPLKKVYYTIPVLKKKININSKDCAQYKIILIPQIKIGTNFSKNNSSDIEIIFKPQTKLTKNK